MVDPDFQAQALQHLDALAAQSETFARGLALRGRTLEEQGAFFDFVDQRGRDRQARLLAIGRQRRDLVGRDEAQFSRRRHDANHVSENGGGG